MTSLGKEGLPCALPRSALASIFHYLASWRILSFCLYLGLITWRDRALTFDFYCYIVDMLWAGNIQFHFSLNPIKVSVCSPPFEWNWNGHCGSEQLNPQDNRSIRTMLNQALYLATNTYAYLVEWKTVLSSPFLWCLSRGEATRLWSAKL